eukprot:m.161827 g.161827  ORF g.161827 m.161827 type:complete len:1367 (+) comp17656_c0_seq1:68-4168(+)
MAEDEQTRTGNRQLHRKRSQSMEEFRRPNVQKTLSLDLPSHSFDDADGYEQFGLPALPEEDGRPQSPATSVRSFSSSRLGSAKAGAAGGRFGALRVAALSLGQKDMFREALEEECRSSNIHVEWLTLLDIKDGHTQPLNVFNTADLLIVDHAEQPYDSFLTYKLSMRKNLQTSRWSVVIYKNTPKLRKDPPKYRSCESRWSASYREKADGIQVELQHKPENDAAGVSPAGRVVLTLRQYLNSLIRDKLEDMPALDSRDCRFKERLDQAFDSRLTKGNRLTIIGELEKMMQESPEFASTDRILSVLYSYLEIEQWDGIIDLIEQRYHHTGIADIHPEIAYYYAFALNRRNQTHGKKGDRDIALTIAEKVSKEIQTKDAFGLVGRIYKDRFIESIEKDVVDYDSCEKAIDAYRHAFEIEESYGGVNLLTLLYVSAQFDTPERITERTRVAREMLHQFGKTQENADYWIAASRMETSLLEDQWTLANEACEEMQVLCTRSWMLKTTVRNVRLILDVRERRETQGLIKPAQDEATLKQQALFNFWVEYFSSSTKSNLVVFPVIVEHSGINPVGGVRFRYVSIEPATASEGSCFQFISAVGNDESTVAKYLFDRVPALQPEDKPHEAEENVTDKRSVYMIASRGQQTDVFHVSFSSEGCRTMFLERAALLGYTMPCDGETHTGGVSFHWEYVRRNGSRVEVGSGSTATVYEGMSLDVGNQSIPKTLAIKAVRADKMEGMSATEFSDMLNQEILTLRTLHCENLVQFYGWQPDDEEVCIIMEYVPGGSLTKMLDMFGGLAGTDTSMFFLAGYTKQILDALLYLHERNMVHRDIKGDNVLVNQYTGTLKLTDMGTVKRLRGLRRRCRTSVFTPWFAAPEVYNDDSYGFPADIWSLGCTVWQMAKGEPPGVRKDERAVRDDRIKKMTPPIDDAWQADLKQFLSLCFIIDTKQRATVTSLVSEPLLTRALALQPPSSPSPLGTPRKTYSDPMKELTVDKPVLLRAGTVEPSMKLNHSRQLSATQMIFARSISTTNLESWDHAACRKTIIKKLVEVLKLERPKIIREWQAWAAEHISEDMDVETALFATFDAMVKIMGSNAHNRQEETMLETVRGIIDRMCTGEVRSPQAAAQAAGRLHLWTQQFSPKSGKKSRKDGSHWLLKLLRRHGDIEPHWIFVIATECDEAVKAFTSRVNAETGVDKKTSGYPSRLPSGDKGFRPEERSSPLLPQDSAASTYLPNVIGAQAAMGGDRPTGGGGNTAAQGRSRSGFAALLENNHRLLESNQRLLAQLEQEDRRRLAAAAVSTEDAQQTFDFVGHLGLSNAVAEALIGQGLTFRVLSKVPVDKEDLRDCGIPVGPRAVLLAGIRNLANAGTSD